MNRANGVIFRQLVPKINRRLIANKITNRFLSIQRKERWESVIGLEVHAQISADSKLFSKGGTKFGAPVNSSVSFFDAAIPGTLPVLNKKCVEAAVLTALSLSCTVNPVSWFDRKHYFYADSPAGYQITQQRKAIANNGQLDFVVYNAGVHKTPYFTKSRIRQLQLEQDSGKSLHVPQGNRSLIDLNRAGIALMEIVFEPDLKDGEEAAALVKELCLILQLIETCSCRMEEGALRVDANISVNKTGEGLGTRTEVKNLSSIRSLVNAIEFEVQRQIESLEQGKSIVNETRGFDSITKETVPMRDKEVMQDYRFMPEPNLPPLKLTYNPNPSTENNHNVVNIAHTRRKMKELPEVTRKRLMKEYGLRLETTILILNTVGFLKYFKTVMKNKDPKLGIKVANIMSTEIMEELNARDLTFDFCPITPEALGELVDLLDKDLLNFNKAKEVLELIFEGDVRTPVKIMKEEGWEQVTQEDEILKACELVLSENPKLLSDFKSKGKQKYFNQLVGKVKSKTEGKYNMKKVTEIIEKLLKESP